MQRAQQFQGGFYRIATAFVVVALGLGGCKPHHASQTTKLTIGYQKWGTVALLKSRGDLESRLLGEDISVEWIEFASGPPLLEALNAGSIDLGHTGDSPPLFAQAAGTPFFYIAASTESPDSSAIVVKNESTIKSVEDLRGKRIGFVKGSSAHTFVVAALAKAKLKPSDVNLIYLAPADARAALEGGSIDAWSIWDPYLAVAEHS